MNRGNAMDAAKGAIAGTVGVWLMGQVTWGMYLREASQVLRQEQKARVWGEDVAHVAAEKLAGAIGLERSSAQPHPAGMVVHYALGVVPGALYAPLRRRVKAFLGAGQGLLYGLGLTIVNDEILAPVLGLASGPTHYPWQAHARGLVGHLVLGAATDTVLEVVDRVR